MATRPLPLLFRILLPLLILFAGVGIWFVLKKPSQAQRASAGPSRFASRPTGQTAREVELVALNKTNYQVLLPSRGEPRPSESTALVTELEGEVLTLSPQFEVGSFVPAGHVLLELDKQDLMSEVAISESRVAQSEASLAQEEARAKQAALNWNDMGYTEPPGALVLRKPQLKQAAAALKAARAQLGQAQRRLEHASLRVPYDAVVVEKKVSRGQRLPRGEQVGQIVATHRSQIRLPVAMVHESFLPHSLSGQKIELSHPVRTDSALRWEGTVIAREPVVDPSTKQLHLIGEIQDPYSLQNPQKAPLPMGHPVEARIEGKTLEGVYVVPKAALRSPNTIHIAGPERTLAFLEIEPIWTDEKQIVFRAPLQPDTLWVKTIIRRASEGMLLAPKREQAQQ